MQALLLCWTIQSKLSGHKQGTCLPYLGHPMHGLPPHPQLRHHLQAQAWQHLHLGL